MGMAEEPERPDPDNPEEWIRDAVRRMFEGAEGFDPIELAKAAGFTGDPSQLQAMVEQFAKGLSGAMANSELAARDHAVRVAGEGASQVEQSRASALAQVFRTASVWLNEATDFAEPEGTPLLMSRQDWARATLPVWQEMADPVALALSEAIGELFEQQAPEELRETMSGSPILRTLTTGLFRIQLAQVVGTLAREVLSGGDIGVALMHAADEHDVRAGLLPQNIEAFGSGLGVPEEELDYYLAIRELAHQRLFRHARWLRLHLMSLISDFARGIHIDGDALMDLAESISPNNPEEISRILSTGQLLPERTEAQERALVRLETMLALIEGWVDHVTAIAASRLPAADKIAEAIRRRRATGGPAEQAFKTLVGLELRPRRLREASTLWSLVTEAKGPAVRDALWDHPDHLPTEDDLDSPETFVAKLGEPVTEETDVDRFLDDVLGRSGDQPEHGPDSPTESSP